MTYEEYKEYCLTSRFAEDAPFNEHDTEAAWRVFKTLEQPQPYKDTPLEYNPTL